MSLWYISIYSNYGFTIIILAAVLVILFILIQIFGIAYGVSFFG